MLNEFDTKGLRSNHFDEINLENCTYEEDN